MNVYVIFFFFKTCSFPSGYDASELLSYVNVIRGMNGLVLSKNV